MRALLPSASRWKAILDDFGQSRLTHAEFCRRRGLSLHSFRKRLYDARSQATAGNGLPRTRHQGFHALTSAPRFLPVTVVPSPPASAAPSPALEVVLPDGLRIAVPVGFDQYTLRLLVQALRGEPC